MTGATRRLERLGFDPESRRELALLHVTRPGDLVAFRAPSPHVACLLAWDSVGESTEVLVEVARAVLDSGCVVVCVWGQGCDRVHDVIDEVALERGGFDGSGPVVLTSWHEDEPLEEALFFFLRCTDPDAAFRETCRSGVAVVVGEGDERLSEVWRALSEPAEFVRSLASADGERAGPRPRGPSGLRVGVWCLVAGLLGRAAVLLVALLFPGGHPPLSAYVEVPVTLALLPVNLAGGVACARAAWRDRRRRPALVAAGNLALVVVGALSLARGAW